LYKRRPLIRVSGHLASFAGSAGSILAGRFGHIGRPDKVAWICDTLSHRLSNSLINERNRMEGN
jgi:hypothetical protein